MLKVSNFTLAALGKMNDLNRVVKKEVTSMTITKDPNGKAHGANLPILVNYEGIPTPARKVDIYQAYIDNMEGGKEGLMNVSR